MKRFNVIVFTLSILIGCSSESEEKEQACLYHLQKSNHCQILKSRIHPSNKFNQDEFMLNSQYEFECIRPCKE